MRGRPKNSSDQVRTVFKALEDNEWHYGYEIKEKTGLKIGTLYGILKRLTESGEINSRWMVVNGKPRKMVRKPN